MKKTILTTIILLSLNFSANAQFIRNPEIELEKTKKNLTKEQKILINISALNGLWVGYGMYCKIPKDTVEIMHNKYIISIVNRVKEEKDKQLALSEYQNKYDIAIKTGPSYTKTDCNYIVEEYKKMKKAMDSDVDILLNNKVDSVVIRKKK